MRLANNSSSKFVQRGTLSRTFVLFFTLAISLPLISLLRIGYDSYSQRIELTQRMVVGEHERLATEIEDTYSDYLNLLKKLNKEFYNHKVFNKIPGSTDRRMWFYYTGKTFLRQFNEDDLRAKKYRELNYKDGKWVMDDFSGNRATKQAQLKKYNRVKNNFHLRYLKHRSAYQKVVWEALSTAPRDQYNPWRMPIKMQIYVWEQWLSRNKKGMLFSEARPPEYEKYLHDRESYIEKRGNQFSQFSIKYGESIRDSSIFRNMMSQMPMHQIYLSDTHMLNWSFDELASVFNNILVANTFGKELLKRDNNIEAFKRITGTDLLNDVDSFVPLKLFKLDLEVYWNLLPVDFNRKDYLAGKSRAPTAAYCAIFDKAMAEEHYMGLIRGENRTKYLQPITEKLDQIEKNLYSEETNFSVIDINRYKRRADKNTSGNSIILNYSKAKGFEHTRETKTISDFDDLTDDQGFFKVNELIGVLSDETGEFSRKGKDLIRYLNDSLRLVGNPLSTFHIDPTKFQDARLNSLIDLSIKQNKPLYFSYKKKGEDMLGLLFPSSAISNKIFLFTQSQSKLRRELVTDQFIVVGVILLSVSLVFILGGILSRSIIRPILQLTMKISRMADGKYDEKVFVKTVDEIGELGNRFNQMAENIKDKLFQMRSVGVVNLLMNHDLPRRVMLKYILHLLCIKYNASYGLIGFFENGLSTNYSSYPAWKNIQIDEDQESSLVEKIIEELYPQNSSFVFFDRQQLEKLGLPFDNALSFFSSPALQSTKQEDLSESIEVYGMLFLADVDENLIKTLQSDEDKHKNPVYNLCNQAKTVVVKTLLDEIEGDTRKGQEIQEGLMPSTSPDSKGCLDVAHYFKGARGLAGDYLDLQSSATGEIINFSIVDVSGKGIGPSLFGAKSRACMRVLSDRHPYQSGNVLQQLNENLCRNKKDDLFLTMFYCSIDLNSLGLFYASAGHNKMFLIKPDGTLKHLNAKGIPIGLFSPSVYSTEECQLEVGDSIVLYTDGVTELENAAKELYGQETFEKFCIVNRGLSSQEFVDALNDELDRFRQGVFPSDDITYMMIRVLGKASEA